MEEVPEKKKRSWIPIAAVLSLLVLTPLFWGFLSKTPPEKSIAKPTLGSEEKVVERIKPTVPTIDTTDSFLKHSILEGVVQKT